MAFPKGTLLDHLKKSQNKPGDMEDQEINPKLVSLISSFNEEDPSRLSKLTRIVTTLFNASNGRISERSLKFHYQHYCYEKDLPAAEEYLDRVVQDLMDQEPSHGSPDPNAPSPMDIRPMDLDSSDDLISLDVESNYLSSEVNRTPAKVGMAEGPEKGPRVQEVGKVDKQALAKAKREKLEKERAEKLKNAEAGKIQTRASKKGKQLKAPSPPPGSNLHRVQIEPPPKKPKPLATTKQPAKDSVLNRLGTKVPPVRERLGDYVVDPDEPDEDLREDPINIDDIGENSEEFKSLPFFQQMCLRLWRRQIEATEKVALALTAIQHMQEDTQALVRIVDATAKAARPPIPPTIGSTSQQPQVDNLANRLSNVSVRSLSMASSSSAQSRLPMKQANIWS